MTTRNRELRKRENRGYYFPEDNEEKPQKELSEFIKEEQSNSNL